MGDGRDWVVGDGRTGAGCVEATAEWLDGRAGG